MTDQEFLKVYEEKEADLSYKKRKLNNMTESLRSLRVLFDKQTSVLYKEREDVEELSKLSVKNLFNRIANKMDEIAEKEEQEYLAAKVRYEELENSINLTESNIANTKAEIASLEKELTDLKQAGRMQFAEIDKKFTEMENEIKQLRLEIKELNEAIAAGNRVCDAIARAIKKLEAAHGWATYDMFSRGGLISHMAKYGNIDDAQEIVKQIGHLIDVFQSELKDVNVVFQGGVNQYDGTTRFVDYFFDNIFTDMSVRGQIKDDISTLSGLRSEIETVITKLITMRDEKQNKISVMQ